jgi:hypothetical protein
MEAAMRRIAASFVQLEKARVVAKREAARDRNRGKRRGLQG